MKYLIKNCNKNHLNSIYNNYNYNQMGPCCSAEDSASNPDVLNKVRPKPNPFAKSNPDGHVGIVKYNEILRGVYVKDRYLEGGSLGRGNYGTVAKVFNKKMN